MRVGVQRDNHFAAKTWQSPEFSTWKWHYISCRFIPLGETCESDCKTSLSFFIIFTIYKHLLKQMLHGRAISCSLMLSILNYHVLVHVDSFIVYVCVALMGESDRPACWAFFLRRKKEIKFHMIMCMCNSQTFIEACVL